MSTIILSGSPKGNSDKSNSKIFADEFVRKMKNPCEVKYIANSNYRELAEYIKNFNSIIFILPLYIHAMPGIVMKFIEELEPLDTKNKSMGFIVQAGFIETSQHRFLERYLENLVNKLNYTYLGTVSKGEAAGIYMYPRMFKKVLRLINDLGENYEKTNAFNESIVKKLEIPYDLTKSQLVLLNLVNTIGLGNIGWHKMLKKNNAFHKRLDRPFAEK